MEDSETPRKKRRRLRLEALLLEFGGAAQVARESGTPKSHFSAMVSGARGLGDTLAAKLESIYNKPEGWFDLPIEEAATSSLTTVQVASLSPTPAPGAPVVHVPLLANAGSMGPGNEVQHEDVMMGSLALSADWVSKRIHPCGELSFIHAYGDSMSPTFADGDVLLVDTGARDPSMADGVYVLSTSQRLFIKRVTGRFDGGFDVTSDNPTVKTVGTLDGSQQIDVLGRVVWAWNGKKL